MEESEAKLSYSGRLSLTDIVKTTILTDEEHSQSPKPVSYTYEDISDTETETKTQEIPNNGLIFTNQPKDFARKNDSCGIKPGGFKRTYSECDIDNTCVYQSKKLCKEILNQSQQNLSANGNTQSLPFPSWNDLVNQSTHAAYGKFSSYQPAEQSSTPVAKESDVYFSSNSSINCSPAVDSRPNDALSLLCSSPVSQNPLFADLYEVLVVDCNMGTFPHTLLSVLNIEKREEDVSTREHNLQHQFNNLKDKCPVDIQQLSNFYHYESALINTERFRSLHEKQFPISCKDYLIAHYNIEHHMLIDRVEKSMTLWSPERTDVLYRAPDCMTELQMAWTKQCFLSFPVVFLV
ncbi:hypothetical protein CHS0354_009224 [Potamilus streckersoni]|uniref:Uncharacterized protein n=1 Tax=Potamilus streckersoni TaxID=2493646 RepID=A0AAE0T025_9BIVA|nr:hypothetical protein CHS0354_009224 [Potamilus streckersoni]